MHERRLIMLGVPPETRGSIAAVVGTYRAQGLFKRWPIDYFATPLPALGRVLTAAANGTRLAVHAHMSVADFWRDAALVGVALTLRCPVLIQLHGTGFERFYDECEGVSRALVRAMLERAAGVLVPTELLRRWVHGTARQANVACLPNPVAIEPLTKDPAHPNLVLFLGHMAPDKGVFDLLEAVAAVRGLLPDVRLVCAGDGDRVAVARYAERLGIAEVVKFTGWVGPSGKRALFEAAAVLAAPSYDAALPMSLLEAMAAGVPVAAAAVGGIPEVIADGVSGMLVPPGDSASLAKVLKKLLLDRAHAARIAAAGRETVRLRHAPERALPRLEEMYARLGFEPIAAPAPAAEADLRKAA
jgi:glycosyltransferase involved in cell wall biosynthesis